FYIPRLHPRSTLFPYTTLFRSAVRAQLKMPQLRVEWVPVTPATRIPAIVDGKADLECGSTTNNRERREQVAFTIPHYIAGSRMRSEEHTSELQSRRDLVCRLLL